MQLPNYFIADLPSGARIDPAMIREAALTLKRNRQQYLARRTTAELIEFIDELARNWRNPEDRFRQHALSASPQAAGFPAATLARGLDALFSTLTREGLEALIEQDLGNLRALDQFVPAAGGGVARRSALARGPLLLVQITAGNVVAPAVLSMVLGLLLRSAQIIKCASGASLLPRLFAHSIYELEPKLGSCLELVEWPGGHQELEDALCAEADGVTVTGSDETVASVRNRLPAHVRFAGYGNRLSFGYVTRESLSGSRIEELIRRAVDDVTAWNQLGCLSPHLFYVEAGGAVAPDQFAGLLAQELERREGVEARGEIPSAHAAVIRSRRSLYELRAAASAAETCVWASSDSTAWTVIYEADPRFQISCLHRFVHVKPVRDPAEAMQAAEMVRERVSTVGLGANSPRAGELALEFARWGATRICPLGSMQEPPLLWRHDGRPALGELVTWTDWER